MTQCVCVCVRVLVLVSKLVYNFKQSQFYFEGNKTNLCQVDVECMVESVAAEQAEVMVSSGRDC